MGVYKKIARTAAQYIYQDGTAATPEDYERFLGELSKLSESDARYWEILYGQEPVVRLKINLIHIIDTMLEGSVTTVIPDGVDANELKRLEGLSKLSPMSQVVGHELLNLRERQRFVDEFRVIFNAHRCKGGASDGQEEGEGVQA